MVTPTPQFFLQSVARVIPQKKKKKINHVIAVTHGLLTEYRQDSLTNLPGVIIVAWHLPTHVASCFPPK